MPTSDNHDYNVPNEGDPNWHVPLNENFRDFDADIEIRDAASARGSYTPKDGGQFLATDTGVVSLGDGSSWTPTLALARFGAPATSGAAGNLVAGHPNNGVDGGVSGATIAGGGFDDGTDVWPNEVTADYGTIAGGQNNSATAGDATVGGGQSNTASGANATVGGGAGNVASDNNATVSGGNAGEASGGSATVGGGFTNEASALYATVAGGDSNVANGPHATVSGGDSNEATDTFAAVGGGNGNVASARAATVAGGDGGSAEREGAAVGGGLNNTASGFRSTVGGGQNNLASHNDATVGGGTGNTAGASGATVGGGDGNEASGLEATVGGGNGNVASGRGATIPGGDQHVADGDNSFAAGGLFADTNGQSGAIVLADDSSSSVTADAANQFVVQASGGAKIYSDTSSTSGVELPPGDGSWASLSARASKANVEPVDPADALAGVCALEISSWNYESQDESVRHVGPMAEDFHDEFGLGDDPERISTVDADGVALAAIQGLADRLEERDERIEELAAENESLRERLSAVEARVGTIDGDGTERAPADD